MDSDCRGGLVLKAHRLVYHSTLGSRVIKKKMMIRMVNSRVVREPEGGRAATSPQSRTKSPLSIPLISTGARWNPATWSANQGSRKRRSAPALRAGERPALLAPFSGNPLILAWKEAPCISVPLSYRMYLLISLRKPTPPQNRQLILLFLIKILS